MTYLELVDEGYNFSQFGGLICYEKGEKAGCCNLPEYEEAMNDPEVFLLPNPDEQTYLEYYQKK